MFKVQNGFLSHHSFSLPYFEELLCNLPHVFFLSQYRNPIMFQRLYYTLLDTSIGPILKTQSEVLGSIKGQVNID